MRTKKVFVQYVAVRLDDELIARIDAFVPVLSSASRQASRSEVVRAAIWRGLDNFERDPEGAKREMSRVESTESEPEREGDETAGEEAAGDAVSRELPE